MAKRKMEIRVEAFVRVGEELRSVDSLDREQLQRLGTWIKREYLTELYRGKVRFEEAGQ